MRTVTTRFFLFLCVACPALIFSGCATTGAKVERPTPERLEMYRSIAAEPRGDHYIGRRYYKSNMGFWGYVRRPGQPWHEAKLVMMNENTRFAPDREQGTIGIDDNHEYRLFGRMGPEVYEPAGNQFLPEFILRDYELISEYPPSIFRNNYINDPEENVIMRPQQVDPSQFPPAPGLAAATP
jgi:hypothetical protein